MTIKLTSEKVPAITIKPGNILSFFEGDFVVRSAKFGDANVDGLVRLGAKTTAPWIIELENGPRIVMHPHHMVARKV